MEFFHSLTIDVKLLIAAMVGVVLLALFSSNQKAEKRCLVMLALLAVAGVYRYQSSNTTPSIAAEPSAQRIVTASPVRKPIVSTSAK